jgi:transglutaminase-like putative cysteine protease
MNQLPTTPTPTPITRYRVIHRTDYGYQSMVTLSQQYLHLTPRSFRYQKSLSHRITVDPTPNDWSDGIDYFGNLTNNLTLTTPHQVLVVHAESEVELYARPGLAQITGSVAWEVLQDSMRLSQGATSLEPFHFLYSSPHILCSNALQQYALASFTPGRPLLDAALDLTYRIFDEFEFDSEATNISTTLDEVLTGRRGVCQDFAHLMIGCLRSVGLPARYVSGYILTHPSAGQMRLIGADASHAWVSVFSPDWGWVDFDPTNRSLVQHEHITLGWGRDFSDVTPMRGIVLGGGQQILGVSVTVSPLQDAQDAQHAAL